jgi:hypothetical protein
LFLPLSSVAYAQLLELKADLQALQLQSELLDEWIYAWGSGIFSSYNAYCQLQGPYSASVIQVDVEVTSSA